MFCGSNDLIRNERKKEKEKQPFLIFDSRQHQSVDYFTIFFKVDAARFYSLSFLHFKCFKLFVENSRQSMHLIC